MNTIASTEIASTEAERLQSAIDGITAGAGLEDVARSLGGVDEAIKLAALAVATERACHGKAPAAMRARQQVALQEEFERQREHRHAAGADRGLLPGSRWLAIRLIAGLLAIALATGSAVVVSADSLPGEVLYPVKLAAEGARVALSGDARSRAALRLELAGERWSEIRRLVDLGIMPSPQLIDAMLDTFALSARDAELSGDADLIAFTLAELDRYRDALRKLAEETDAATRRMIQAALGNADDPPGDAVEPPAGSSAGDPPRTDRGASGPAGAVTATSRASEPSGSDAGESTPAPSPSASPEPSPTTTDEPTPTQTSTPTPTESPPGGAGGPPVAPPPAEPPAEPTNAPPDEPGETPVPDNPRATERARGEQTPPPGLPTRRRP